MDSSGRIHYFENDEEREKLEKVFGELVELTPEEAARLKAAKLEERLQVYRTRAFNAPPVGLDADDAQKAKNAAKRERKERG